MQPQPIKTKENFSQEQVDRSTPTTNMGKITWFNNKILIWMFSLDKAKLWIKESFRMIGNSCRDWKYDEPNGKASCRERDTTKKTKQISSAFILPRPSVFFSGFLNLSWMCNFVRFYLLSLNWLGPKFWKIWKGKRSCKGIVQNYFVVTIP